MALDGAQPQRPWRYPPLHASQAEGAHERALELEALGGGAGHRDVLELAGRSEMEIAAWLDCQLGEKGADVTLSWGRRTAARVPWRLFRRSWDDFCFASSDDVMILPEDERWALVYRHTEQFEFGLRAV